jgi:hypothetical protein
MGIDIQALRLLKFAHDRGGAFGKVLTVGRQGLHCSLRGIEMVLGVKPSKQEKFCESLLINHFGAVSVDSIDASPYEGASIVHDLNKPVSEMLGQFDTIIDGGCLEHIFDIAEALRNLSRLCAVGGQILHVLPANNQCGHGFWQVSPELFFSLYTERREYRETEVFLADVNDPAWVQKVIPPTAGARHDIRHANPLYVMVRTVLSSHSGIFADVQQSDYVYEWGTKGDGGWGQRSIDVAAATPVTN